MWPNASSGAPDDSKSGRQRPAFLARPARAAVLRTGVVSLLAGVVLVFGYRYGVATGVQELEAPRQAPAFTHRDPADWINSPPLDLAALRGRVVLLDVWTFDCWNCYRSIPWLKSVESRYAPEGLQVIGVHAPEFEHERVRSAVERKVKEFGIVHPVMLDNDFSYWNALENRFWPTYYLIDRRGNLRAYYVGEMHSGQARARAVEARLEELLRETVPE